VRRWPVLLAALALALAGCGGDGDSGSEEDAAALLKRGFATDVDSGVLTLDAEVALRGVEGADGPLRLTLEGPFRAAGSPTEMPDLDMDYRVSGAGQTFSGNVIVTRENGWVEYEGETYEAGEELWARLLELLRQSNQGQPRTFREAGIDPLDWIDDAATGGEEEIGGTPTTKVTGTLDVEAMLRDVNRISSGDRVPERTLREVDEVVDDVEFEAWIGEDDIWRRISARTEFEVPEDERDGVGGLEGGRFSLDMELAEPNEPVEIEGPAEARPIDELLRGLGIPPELLLGPGFATPTPG
jgi:hypothetical protein